MELIFGEGTDGDCEATILGPLADGNYVIDVDWNNVTDPAPGRSATVVVSGISNANGGELYVYDANDGAEFVGTIVIPIHHITRLEIH